MAAWFKKKATVDELGLTLTAILSGGDETRISKLFDELIQHTSSDAQKVEGLLGHGILVACESRLQCSGKYVMWFLKQFPNSLAPVKVEYAWFLSNNNPDSATQLAREYLRYVNERGAMNQLASMPMIRRGSSKAFLIITAAYTTLGARSYSQRILEHASSMPLDPDYIDMYRVEIGRLSNELNDQENARQND